MYVEAFGYRSLSLDMVIEGLNDIKQMAGTGSLPVWVRTSGGILAPVSNVKALGGTSPWTVRPILEVHHG